MVMIYPLAKHYKIFDLIFVLGAGFLLVTGFLNMIGA
jgi:hypothetical protein